MFNKRVTVPTPILALLLSVTSCGTSKNKRPNKAGKEQNIQENSGNLTPKVTYEHTIQDSDFAIDNSEPIEYIYIPIQQFLDRDPKSTIKEMDAQAFVTVTFDNTKYLKDHNQLIKECNRACYKAAYHNKFMKFFNEKYAGTINHILAPRDLSIKT